MIKDVWVIDPGTSGAGGHHAALLNGLLNGLLNTDLSGGITILTHQLLDKQLLTRVPDQISVIPWFASNFYQHYEDGPHLGPAGCQRYIRELALEYRGGLVHCCAKRHRRPSNKQNSPTLVVYPCLNWEHAMALDLALSTMPQGDCQSLKHIVCCMFSPDKRHRGIDNLWYALGFDRLQRHVDVQLYATDFETKAYYDSLGVYIRGIHPSYLLPWDVLRNTLLNKAKPLGEKPPTLLLYMGDAKEDKGFKSLPALSKALITQYKDNIRLKIQFTLAWESPELTPVITELRGLAGNYSQLELHQGFWPQDQLIAELAAVDAIVCTYDSKVYQHKSSGLAWLAAFFGKPIWLPEKSWLSRELDRLGAPVIVDPILDVEQLMAQSAARPTSYATEIFEDFLEWLQTT